MGTQKDSRDGQVDGWVDCYASLKRKGEEHLGISFQHTFVFSGVLMIFGKVIKWLFTSLPPSLHDSFYGGSLVF